jgi:predicted peroxiredoxin
MRHRGLPYALTACAGQSEHFRVALGVSHHTSNKETTVERRGLISRLAFLPLFAGAAATAEEPKKPLKIMFKSAWGSDDPTKAAFAFLHGNALAEAGHSVQIFLLGEATSLMRVSVAHAVVPVGWPPLFDALTKATANKIQIYACGACSRARGVNEADLTQWGAKFGNPTIFISLVEWADRIITE